MKLIPRIEQLLRENAALRNGTSIDDDVNSLISKNQYLEQQVDQMRTQLQTSYKSREERADLLMQIE